MFFLKRKPSLYLLKVLAKLILWVLSSEKRRKRLYLLLKPVVKLYGRILFGTMRGVYGVALWLLAYALSYFVKLFVRKARVEK
ncbi:hypothetical protein IAE16_04210 [Hydrogenobacter sp. T-2]|uniref:hypothetical protein n=1 Tax=Pampinifervens diazotrophicum TaxID=1632018 RepID=UPI002B25AC29|nr:hypothetical protein [Hydrogenobacter sp. T-2]WPM32888.1 hypothetical protein IAE16_04210 [Hydrogenobacter sp. T-2]